MWYSSKSQNEKSERPEKVRNFISFPVELGEPIDRMHAKNISPNEKNEKRVLLNNKAITYCLLFVLLLITAGVTARQLLVKKESDKNEAFRMKKLNDANSSSNNINSLTIITQNTSNNETLARYSVSLVLLHVEEWKNFWSSKNIRGFMSFYHKNFPDKKNFEDNKRRIFSKEQFIEIDISNVESEAKSDSIVVRFTQRYSSKSFSDTARKELIWTTTEDGWKIISERIIR
jgi:hypothetical protein